MRSCGSMRTGWSRSIGWLRYSSCRYVHAAAATVAAAAATATATTATAAVDTATTATTATAATSNRRHQPPSPPTTTTATTTTHYHHGILFLQGRYDDSVEMCLKVLELKPWHFGALSGIVMCYSR